MKDLPFRRAGICGLAAVTLLLGVSRGLFGVCGPFTDVSDAVFCPFVLEIFYLGVTTGTTATTYSPADPVSRIQMATFLSRTVDGVLRRGNPRAAAQKFWTPQTSSSLGLTSVGNLPMRPVFDGLDVWVPSNAQVNRVRASDGRLLETWTGFSGSARGIVLALGRVVISGDALYMIDPSQAAGVVTTVATNQTNVPDGIAFDGARVWTANTGGPGSISIVTPTASVPWTVTNVTVGFSRPVGALFDGANVWVTNKDNATIVELDTVGAVISTVTVGNQPLYPVFDGTNIWVPNSADNSVSVVRASTGRVLQTLTGNGLSLPTASAFDGERVMVTSSSTHAVSLWKAADLTAVGFLLTGASTFPQGACSDGRNFWVTFHNSPGKLARF